MMNRFQILYMISMLLALSIFLSACTSAEPATDVQKNASETEENMAGMAGDDIPSDLDTSTERMTDQGVFQVRIASNLDPVDINEIHSWTLHLATPGGQAIEGADIVIDGGMPQHNHGFPTSPQVSQELGQGDYLVEGVRFNMVGWWEMKFDITANGQADTITFNLVVETGHDDGGMVEMDHSDHEAHADMLANGQLTVEHIVGNLALPTDTGAVYLTILNGTDHDEALLAASIEGCDTLEFHETTMQDDVMKMAPVEGGQVSVPAGETINLEQGGMHIMCIGKSKPFAVGDQVPVVLTFANAGQVEGMVEVREPGDMEMDHDSHDDHEAMDTHEHNKIPNNGAAISIVSPAASAEVKAGEMVMVKVQTEGFDLSAENNHWHLYVDGELVEMIEGSRTETMLHDLEAGEHTLMTTMADADHNELQDGAMISIMVK